MEAADAPSGEFPDETDAGEADEAAESPPSPSLGNERRAPAYKVFTTGR